MLTLSELSDVPSASIASRRQRRWYWEMMINCGFRGTRGLVVGLVVEGRFSRSRGSPG